MTNLAKIVPVKSEGVTRTQGTQVWVGSEQLEGVTKIELVAEVNDVWRAVIHCHALPADISAVTVIRAPSLWQRVKAYLLGGSGA